MLVIEFDLWIWGERLWRYRLMVRTLVFETSNPGSIPGDAMVV